MLEFCCSATRVPKAWGGPDHKIHELLGVGIRTIERARKRFVEESFEQTVNPRPRPRGTCEMDRTTEAQIVELAKSTLRPDANAGHCG